MPSAFLSYSNTDLRLVEKLEKALRECNIEVLRDKTILSVGESWPEALGRAIAKADFFILVWSKHAAGSEAVKKEWTAAYAQNKTILPCLLDTTPLPETLRGIQAVDGRDVSQAGSQICQAIGEPHLRPPQQRKPRPTKPLIATSVVAIGAILLWLWARPYFRGSPDDDNVLRLARGVQVEFVEIRAGSFQMGSETGDADEGPVLTVKINQAFQLGKTEVTQRQWEAVSGQNPSHFKGDRLPVENVSWGDIQEFLRELNSRGDIWLYRLPTEAEWEYSARSGGAEDEPGSESEMERTTWYRANSGGRTREVGRKKPNAWGLQDMRGNVWEWVEDWYADSYVDHSNPVSDPLGPPSGSHRVIRGGGWDSSADQCRSANRGEAGPDSRGDVLGFRLLRQKRN